MDDVISRQAAIDVAREDGKKIPTVAIRIMHDIKALPAADVVPVVRCRDCKHLGTFRGKLYCRHNCGVVEPKEDDFCSYGERKE